MSLILCQDLGIEDSSHQERLLLARNAWLSWHVQECQEAVGFPPLHIIVVLIPQTILVLKLYHFCVQIKTIITKWLSNYPLFAIRPNFVTLILRFLLLLSIIYTAFLLLAGWHHRMPTHFYGSLCHLRYKHVIYIVTIPSRRTSKLFSCMIGWENKLVSCGARNPFILCSMLAPHARISYRSWWGA